jgi:hypothetical protein
MRRNKIHFISLSKDLQLTLSCLEIYALSNEFGIICFIHLRCLEQFLQFKLIFENVILNKWNTSFLNSRNLLLTNLVQQDLCKELFVLNYDYFLTLIPGSRTHGFKNIYIFLYKPFGNYQITLTNI